MRQIPRALTRVVLGLVLALPSFFLWVIIISGGQRLVELVLGAPVVGPNDEWHWAALPALLVLPALTVVSLVNALDKSAPPDRVFVCPDGRPLAGDFLYRLWREAADEAELPGKLLHDLRRTGVRSLVRAGVDERRAMVTGHKTRAGFDRYSITSPRDLREVAERLNQVDRGAFSDKIATAGSEDAEEGDAAPEIDEENQELERATRRNRTGDLLIMVRSQVEAVVAGRRRGHDSGD